MTGHVSVTSRTSQATLVRPSAWQQFTDFANVLKAFIGTSYLALPFAFSKSGLVLGAVGLVIIALITDHCCQLIIKCKNAAVDMILNSTPRYQELRTEALYDEMEKVKETIEKEMTLGDIGKIAVGPWGLRLVNTALIITQLGFCVAYFIFIGNTIGEMFPLKYKSETVIPVVNATLSEPTSATRMTHYSTIWMNSSSMIPPLHSTKTAPKFSLLLLIPFPFLVAMAFVKSIRKLVPISGVANVTLLAGFFGLLAFLLRGLKFNLKNVSYARLSTFPVFFGQLTGAYEGIGTVIPIESSMAENRPRFPLYLHIALAQVSFILGSFGILGYMIYAGSTVPQIVTDRLQTGTVAQLVRLTLIIAVMMTYPLQLYPVIEIAESVLFTKIHSKSKSHLGAVIAGPSMDPDSNPVSPVDSNSIDSHYPVPNSPDDLSTSVNSETQVLIPKETDELQFKTATWKRNLLRAVLVTITAGIAIALKNKFAYVSALTGSLGSSVLAYILPCIFHIVLYKNTNSVAVVIKDIIIVVFGIVGGVVGVVITIQDMVKD